MILNVADLVAEFGGITEPMNVEVLEVVIIHEESRELPPGFSLTGIKSVDKHDELVTLRILSNPIS